MLKSESVYILDLTVSNIWRTVNTYFWDETGYKQDAIHQAEKYF